MVEPLEVECRHFVECVAEGSARSPTARQPCAWCACWKRPSARSKAAAHRSTCEPTGHDGEPRLVRSHGGNLYRSRNPVRITLLFSQAHEV